MGNACTGGAHIRTPSPPSSPDYAGAAVAHATPTQSYSSLPTSEALADLPRRQNSTDTSTARRMRWPNGQLSVGELIKADDKNWRFELAPSDPLLVARKAAGEASALSPLRVRPDPAMPKAARQSVAALPRLRDMHLTAARMLTQDDVMAILSNVSYAKGQAPDTGPGLNRTQQLGLINLYASALDALARQSPLTPGIAAAAHALAHPIVTELSIGFDHATGGLRVQGGTACPPEEVGAAIRQLREGEHMFFPVNYSVLGGAHAVSLSVSRLEGGTRPMLRVSLADTEYSEPGIYIDTSERKVLEALPGFLNGTLGNGGHLPQDDVMDVLLREPLRDWLAQIDPSKVVSSAYFGGKVLEQPIQNGGSCGSENPLAFLATVLPPPEYKLAKAACLNAVLQFAESQLAETDANSIERIKDRVTHALAGSVLR